MNNLRIIYHKLKWVIKNWNKLNNNSGLASNHYLGPITYDTDSLTTSNNCDFINDARFKKAYKAAGDTNPWDGFTLQWRVYINCWFANHIKKLEGDFVECGVNTGAYARAIVEYINFDELEKKYYLLDTFSGLIPSKISDKEKEAGIEIYLTHYKDVYEAVLETFKQFNVKVIKGSVPETLSECETEKICFLSLDMNCVEPEIAAAEYFWPKLVPGAVIILDDYGFPLHIEQKKAFDVFAVKKGVEILTLPTGQGIIIKQ